MVHQGVLRGFSHRTSIGEVLPCQRSNLRCAPLSLHTARGSPGSPHDADRPPCPLSHLIAVTALSTAPASRRERRRSRCATAIASSSTATASPRTAATPGPSRSYVATRFPHLGRALRERGRRRRHRAGRLGRAGRAASRARRDRLPADRRHHHAGHERRRLRAVRPRDALGLRRRATARSWNGCGRPCPASG